MRRKRERHNAKPRNSNDSAKCYFYPSQQVENLGFKLNGGSQGDPRTTQGSVRMVVLVHDNILAMKLIHGGSFQIFKPRTLAILLEGFVYSGLAELIRRPRLFNSYQVYATLHSDLF